MAAFVDTNVLIYAFAAEADDANEKVLLARRLLVGLRKESALVVSAQVLGEFATNAVRKGNPPLTLDQATAIVGELAGNSVVAIDDSLVLLALQRVQKSRISYWDALIVEAAIRGGASILYTEDLHSGTVYDTVEVRNPFQR
ncbi:MAG TPA: PIN domain-containing protein [Acidobacteriaceae bacterium]